MSDFLSSPRFHPSLHCCHFYLKVCIHIISSYIPGYTVRTFCLFQEIFFHFSCHIYFLSGHLFLILNVFISLLIECILFRYWQYYMTQTYLKPCFCAPDFTNAYIILYFFYISYLFHFFLLTKLLFLLPDSIFLAP